MVPNLDVEDFLSCVIEITPETKSGFSIAEHNIEEADNSISLSFSLAFLPSRFVHAHKDTVLDIIPKEILEAACNYFCL